MKPLDCLVTAGIAVVLIGIYDTLRGPPARAVADAPRESVVQGASPEQLARLDERLQLLERRVDGLAAAPTRAPAKEALADERARDPGLPQSADIRGSLEKLVDDGGMQELMVRFQEQLIDHWRRQTPNPKAELIAEGQAKLNEAVDGVYQALEGADGDPEKAKAALAERLKSIAFENPGQVTVVDRDGNYVYHAGGLTGSSSFYKNVNGDPAYAGMLQSKQGSGNTAYFDFVQNDKAREVNLTYRRLNELGWYVLIENYEWKPMQ